MPTNQPTHQPIAALPVQELRQGMIIDAEQLHPEVLAEIKDSRAIARYRTKQVSTKLIVLSQDCDIANPNENIVELVPAKVLNENQERKGRERKFDKPSNYGKLIVRFGGEYLELDAGMISAVEKATLSAPLNFLGELDDREQRILIDWRVGRYNRKPFPDAFNRLFKKFFEEQGLWDFLEQRCDEVSDVWVYVSPEGEEQAAQYDVSVTAEIDQKCPAHVHNEVHEKLYSALKTLHEVTGKDPGIATLNFGQISGDWIFGLPGCTVEITAMSEDISLFDIQFLRTYNTAFACYPD